VFLDQTARQARKKPQAVVIDAERHFYEAEYANRAIAASTG